MLEFQVELIAPKNAAAPERAIAAALVADASDADFNLLNLTCSKWFKSAIIDLLESRSC